MLAPGATDGKKRMGLVADRSERSPAPSLSICVTLGMENLLRALVFSEEK